MSSQKIGYVRVSSSDQNPDRQLQEIVLDRKFVDMITGSKLKRPSLDACIEYVREGDILFIDSIDRLARNLRDLQEIIKTIVAKGVIVKFVKENLSFSATEVDPIANLTLHLMGAFAEFERNMIRARQREGIDLAKKLGKPTGRPAVVTEKLTLEAKQLKSEGISIRQIAFRLKTSRATIYKMLAL
jgi:DNA invertase Pin-like site-specific DNA recombinase